MNNESTIHVQEGTAAHDVHHHDHDGHGHHKESFISKYIFSQDHKMIAKQFLITGWPGQYWAGLCLSFSGYS